MPAATRSLFPILPVALNNIGKSGDILKKKKKTPVNIPATSISKEVKNITDI